MNCPLCGNDELSLVASRRNVPVLQNVLCDTEEKSKQIPLGDIDFFICHACGLVFNEKYEQVDYRDDYENYQGCSHLFDDYLNRNAERVADFILQQKQPVLLLEIGCGQGDFLQRIMARIPYNVVVSGIGFDPAYETNRRGLLDSRCHIVSTYFDSESVAHIGVQETYPVKVCISRHVIEHISDPHMLFRECARLNGNVYLFLETPNVHWILSNNAFEDIIYEHCSLYSSKSINCLLQKHGFLLTAFSNTFGGQYMWVEARKENLIQECIAYTTVERDIIHKWRLWNHKCGGGDLHLGSWSQKCGFFTINRFDEGIYN